MLRFVRLKPNHDQGAKDMSIKGSCLCQGVKYELKDAEFYPVANCYCGNCRKTHGAAFGTYLPIRKGDFRWVEGEDLVHRYVSSPHTYRCFCSVCGSPLAAFDGSHIRCVTMGTIDGDPEVRPEYHMHVRDKVPWYDITDSLPQYELRSPDTRPPATSADEE